MTRTKYTAAQEAFIALANLKTGSVVRVMRSAKDNEMGWGTYWNNKDMDRAVGNTRTVESVDEKHLGIRMTDGFYYPFFVLQPVLPEPVEIKLDSGEYTAAVQVDGSVKVGCQSISTETLDKIHAASVKFRKA